MSVTHLQVLPLSVYSSVGGGNLSRWLTAQCQLFSDNVTSVPHSPTHTDSHPPQKPSPSSGLFFYSNVFFLPSTQQVYNTDTIIYQQQFVYIVFRFNLLRPVHPFLSHILEHCMHNQLNIVISVPAWRLTTSWEQQTSLFRQNYFHWWLQLFQNYKIHTWDCMCGPDRNNWLFISNPQHEAHHISWEQLCWLVILKPLMLKP